MRIMTIDFETYWDSEITLSKMNPIEYVLHPKVEVQTLAVKVNDEPTTVLVGEQAVRDWAQQTDFSDVFLIGHNMSGFDAMLAAWRFGIRPLRWGCTLSMAREAGLAKRVGGSLKALCAHFRLGAKGELNTKGRRLADLSPDEIRALVKYNEQDTELGFKLFQHLLPLVGGLRSLKLIDMTIRMLVEPRLRVDEALLVQTQADVRATAERALRESSELMLGPAYGTMPDAERLEVTKKLLSSSAKFAQVLKDRDIPVPLKPSPSNPEKLIPALAKNDEGMADLLDHEDPVVATLAAARVGAKSTILETRIDSFIRVSRKLAGFMPIPLKYYGAENTGRWSGTMSLNAQNLPRVGKKPKPQDALRNCMIAPPGHLVVVADLSGIELRMNHFLWKVPSSMTLFEADPAKADLYREFAAKLYRKTPAEVTSEERQVGKVAQLGLGYGAGAATYQTIARVMGGVKLTLAEAQDVVDAWRAAYPEIVAGWRRSHACLGSIARGLSTNIDPWGLCHTTEGGIRTPKGFIHYPDLRRVEKDWVYGSEKRPTRIYAGKVVENIVQHLSREVMADMMLKIQKQYHIVHTVHDEIVLVVRESKAQEALDFMQQVMREGVDWFPQLITWSEGSYGGSYGDAK
jgi:hypothetical protein